MIDENIREVTLTRMTARDYCYETSRYLTDVCLDTLGWCVIEAGGLISGWVTDEEVAEQESRAPYYADVLSMGRWINP